MFILKLDASGDFLFAKQLSANSSKILIDSTGNILIACDVQGLPVDFDPGPSVFNITPKENSDVVVCKLTATGDFIWAKQIGGSSYDGSSVLEIDKDNNVFIGGYFYGTCDFDPGPATYNLTSAGESDIFVTKLDASGNFVWARSMGDYYRESIFDLKFDFSGNIVLTGRTEGGGDFDPGADVAYLNGKGGSDCILIKLSGQGNLVWAKLIGSSFDEDGNSLSIDQAGNITLAGAFTGALDLDPGVGIAMTSLSGIFDIFIARYNASGEFITSRQIGGKYWDACKGLFTDPSGNLYMTGTFQGEVDFDPGPRVYSMTGPVSASSAPADIFICKFGKNNQITGTTYFDANHDGSRQPSEFILPNIPVNASRDGFIYQVRSDTNGLFLIEADTGTYSITVPAIAYYPVVVPSTHTASFGSLFGSYDTANHFALQPAGNIKDLR
ncbi:MAG TPA: hypothetical protein VFS31_02430, partial [Chitinophagaceae bacterium]|nr:hypothetical protein [Chitinophagaceae bacterium]